MNHPLGLSSEEAHKRLQEHGSNEVITSKFSSQLEGIKDILLDPMGLMLLALSGIYYFVGNYNDSLILFIAYIPVVLVDVFMEFRTNQALKALRATIKKTAKVYRDGLIKDELTQNLVPGDVLIFEEGQNLPADGRIIQTQDLTLNEAALTGESIPIEKKLQDSFFAGTNILQGRGLGLIEKTGKNTQFGKIASLLEASEKQSSPLQKKVYYLLKRILFFSISLAILLLILEIFRGKTFLQGLISALTFGMASIPEEFPVVFTLYLSFGAWRLSKHGVLVKSLPSVESLGSVDIICTDKTGTLTEGHFQLETLFPLTTETPSEKLWQCALMACEEKITDSMEKAIVEAAPKSYVSLSSWRLIWDYPFLNTDKYMSHVWQNQSDSSFRICMKGSFEGVSKHCKLSRDQRQQFEKLVSDFASQGKRLLALAYREGLCTGDREKDENQLTLAGLLIFTDPVRKTSKQAILRCQEAGIEIKMLTGDHPLTAHAIAHETGIQHDQEIIYTGEDLKKMPQEERLAVYKKASIFSRVLPEQKYEMVQELKKSGAIVAMTGDGINDAPALKIADIGISMGENATDVARSSAQMILLKNDFNGLAEAVLEGRRIFSNLKKSFSYLISFHIPIIILALLPPLLGIGDFFLPIHIVLLELLVHPISAFTFENLSRKTLKEKEIFSKAHFAQASLSGILLSLGALVTFYYHYKIALKSIELSRSIAFVSILIGNIFFVLVESYPEKNRRLFYTLLSLTFLILLLAFEPHLGHLFHLEELTFNNLMVSFSIGAGASIPSFWIKKFQDKK